jgi:hypothetical protein
VLINEQLIENMCVHITKSKSYMQAIINNQIRCISKTESIIMFTIVKIKVYISTYYHFYYVPIDFLQIKKYQYTLLFQYCTHY